MILLDLKMPRVTGLEALEQIRSDAALSTVPVAVLTSSTEESDLAACYRLRANAYVVKPVDFGEFLDAVKKLGCFLGKIERASIRFGASKDDRVGANRASFRRAVGVAPDPPR